jgi:hypothetical protein
MSKDFVDEFDTAISLWIDGNNVEETILAATPENLFELAEVMALICKHHFQKTISRNELFSFTANSALSGGSHPCASIDCRFRRIDNLITFATLYADEVYIQQPFERIAMNGPAAIKAVHRHDLVAAIYMYMRLRALIRTGLVKYATDVHRFCDHHHQTLAAPLAKRIDQQTDTLRRNIIETLLETCSVTYKRTKQHGPFFEVSAPEGVVEHGTLYFHAFQPMPRIFQRFQSFGTSHALSKVEIAESGALDWIVNPILRDIAFQEWHTTLTGTSYLCDNESHMSLVSSINSDAFKANSNAFNKSLKHYLPKVSSQNPEVLLNLREKEGEAFAVYRDKLRKLLQGTEGWSDQDVSRAFRDEVLPEINVLNKRLKDWSNNSKESVGEKLLFGTGAVTLGLYSGILPSDVGQLVAAIGGTSAVTSAIFDWNKAFKEKQQARASDYYFLWQAGED